jgi:hypothetical protein
MTWVLLLSVVFILNFLAAQYRWLPRLLSWDFERKLAIAETKEAAEAAANTEEAKEAKFQQEVRLHLAKLETERKYLLEMSGWLKLNGADYARKHGWYTVEDHDTWLKHRKNQQHENKS